MLKFEIKFLREIIYNKCGANTLLIIKYFNQWKKSQHKSSSPVIDRRPWMTFQSISFIERRLDTSSYIFEYGGGGSTLFFLDRGAKVITVEHDKEWFKTLSNIIYHDNLNRLWTGIYEPPENEIYPSYLLHSNPASYKSNPHNFIGKTFKKYVNKINVFQNDYFDFVIIDGRARPSCVKQSASKVKIGGYLILDNTEREYYLTSETLNFLKNFKLELDKAGPSPHVDFFTKTNIWRRLY